ncbi:MAG: TRAP transporter small permease [Clostridiales bacterium]|nr:TRAP transporter small permease [Clostridiales bacterium]
MLNSPHKKLVKADAAITKVIKSISYVSAVGLVGIMLVTFINVVGEKLRSLGLPTTGIPASTEIISYLHIPVVFLAMSYVTLDRGHVRIDMLTSKFPKWLENACITLGYLLGAGITSFISWRAFEQMGKFIARHRMSSVTGVGFPLWPFALITAVGFALLALSLLWAIVRQYTLKNPDNTEGTSQNPDNNEGTSLKGDII